MSDSKIYSHQKIKLAILSELAEIKNTGDDYFFRSKQFPNYVWGSGAIINSSNLKSFQNIIDQFKAFYPGVAIYSIGYFNQDYQARIAKEAHRAGHTVYTTKIMHASVNELQPVAPLAEHHGLIRIVNNEKDWERYRQHEGDCHTDRWYVEEGYAKKRFVTERLNLRWFALFNKSNTQIVSSGGLLKVDNLAQLKNVQTHPGEQKKGYATAILAEISRLLLEQRTVEEVYLTIDSSNDKSLRLYSKLGFRLLPYEFAEIVIRPRKTE